MRFGRVGVDWMSFSSRDCAESVDDLPVEGMTLLFICEFTFNASVEEGCSKEIKTGWKEIKEWAAFIWSLSKVVWACNAEFDEVKLPMEG